MTETTSGNIPEWSSEDAQNNQRKLVDLFSDLRTHPVTASLEDFEGIPANIPDILAPAYALDRAIERKVQEVQTVLEPALISASFKACIADTYREFAERYLDEDDSPENPVTVEDPSFLEGETGVFSSKEECQTLERKVYLEEIALAIQVDSSMVKSSQNQILYTDLRAMEKLRGKEIAKFQKWREDFLNTYGKPIDARMG